ncbi:hypothetical protein [Soonwooa sp.]|uniref:hypothetical protein n=1 Tax=Soonwooa sp. TaxID=1938592 RepID=UPI0028B17A5C|nr:hypothetical protein [Soonwooa sp.]
MGRKPTYPQTINELYRISITTFKKNGYLTPDSLDKGTITILSNKIPFVVKTSDFDSYLKLGNNTYIKLISKVPNLGIGLMWFFVCPMSGRLCRKLYLYNGAFVGISVIPYNYEQQNYSRTNRNLDKVFKVTFQDAPEEKIFAKYFRTTYSGKPTKRFQQILSQQKKIDKISEDNLYRYVSDYLKLTK